MIKIKKRSFCVSLICIAWLLVIFAFSAMDSNESTNITQITLNFIEKLRNKNDFVDFLFGKLTEQYPIFLIVRKMAHMFVFCILEIIVFNVFRVFNANFIKSSFFSILIVFTYACLDEFHQLFVDGRNGCFTDVLIDTTGGFIGLFIVSLFVFLIYIVKKIKKSII